MDYIACCDASVHERRTRVRNRTLTGNRASKPTRVSTISDCVYTQEQPVVMMVLARGKRKVWRALIATLCQCSDYACWH